MGRRIWVVVFGASQKLPTFYYSTQVTGFKQFLPADPPRRKKHLVQLYTDPGGTRTLSVGSIQLKEAGAKATAAAA